MAKSVDPVVVIGGGPAGMACGLALHTAGIPAIILERHGEARPAGNVLNLWPAAIKALGLIGVDTEDLGAPCHSTFRNTKGHVRADIRIPEQVIEDFGGGFIGMLRPDLYARMIAALPDGMLRTGQEVSGIEDQGTAVRVTFADGSHIDTPVVIGADGINSMVRKHLWGDAPIREHRLHAIAGYTFDEPAGVERNECIISHSRTVQGSYTAIRSHGRDGYQWWVLEAWDPAQPAPADLKAHAQRLAKEFPGVLPAMTDSTTPDHIQRWPLRDRKPLKAWSKGRITLAGDAAHPTSPYAAYGAGMSIGDGYFFGRALAGVDLADTTAVTTALHAYETPRIPHTTMQVQQAYVLGQLFHHAPRPLRPVRDLVLDHTPMLQKQVGERSPREIVAQLDEMGDGILRSA